ncbi:hypothetical protein N9E48_03000 [Paracoccaceae bacterium]|nr:hypothetical protein [Paracoccaceae bacterium]
MMVRSLLLGIVGVLFAQSAIADGDLNTTVIAEFRSYPNSNAGTIDRGQSLELNVDAYQDFGTSRGVLELVARIDDQDSGRRILEARQAYITTEIGGVEIYIGNRQEFWGKAESINIVDVVNQEDAAADQGGAGKLGAPSVSIERYANYGDLQFWYMPNFRELTFNDADAHPSGELPVKAARYQRSLGRNADDFAFRFSTVVNDWDLAGSLFYGTARKPILSVVDMGTALQPYYAEQRSVGLEAQYTGDATLLKWESLHGKQDGKDFFAAVAGLEYTLYGVLDQVWDLGLIAEAQYDERPQVAAERFYVAGLRLTLNDAKDSSLLLLTSQDEAKDQSLISFDASQRINSWSSIDVGAKFFDAKTPSSVFGFLDDDDTISVKLNMFF